MDKYIQAMIYHEREQQTMNLIRKHVSERVRYKRDFNISIYS